MNTRTNIYRILMYLPLLISILMIPMLPDSVPVHFDVGGSIDAWGSKFTLLLFPVATVFMGFFLSFIERLSSRSENNGLYYINITTLLLFNGLSFIFPYKSITAVLSGSWLPDIDISQLTFILFGLVMMAIGNLLKQTCFQDMSGFRTQLFTLSGILMITLNLFLLTGFWALIISLGLTIAASIFSFFAFLDFRKKKMTK